MRSPRCLSDDEYVRTPLANPPLARRKAAGTRTWTWLVVSNSGCSYLEEVGKHSIQRRTGLPTRDLRVLDPVLSYPSIILGRERAIVINMEHIKAIITATEVLLLNSKDPAVAPFGEELQYRLLNSFAESQQAMEKSESDAEDKVKDKWDSPSYRIQCQTRGSSFGSSKEFIVSQETSNAIPELNVCDSRSSLVTTKSGSPKALPFEFKALEVCLESACSCLESETSRLEKEAYPALDALTSKISTLNLERVRQIKSRLAAILGRVQKVRDELEHLLDDDMDMAEMYLTDKLVHQQVDGNFSTDDFCETFGADDKRNAESKSNSESSHGSSSDLKHHIEELEMLLEAYFVQIDGTLNRLTAMNEYVDDTEDYINIILDDKQNHLLQMDVMLNTTSLVINFGILVSGIFGMNIHISLFDAGPTQFLETTFGTIGGCLVLYILALGWGRTKGLLRSL